ncbi:MAG: glutamate-5-semialdehyde dehydrogenase [Treponemataceae bacterium]|nr:glutamate-5-semialdehyde dehydrogenase [Treponemataceae bacterium]
MTLEPVFLSLREGARKLAALNARQKNEALLSVKKSLLEHQDAVLAANAIDVAAAREKGTKESLIDRLSLNPQRWQSIVGCIDTVIAQTDPVGQVVAGWNTVHGLSIRQVRVPLGVAAIIYESRPNVTVDAFALAFKSGNAILLRGSSSALNSNKAIVEAIKAGLAACADTGCGIPEAVELAQSGQRDEVTEILTAKGYIDVALPRGNAPLIKMVCETATVPVIETGSGICHLYIDDSADIERAVNIAENAKLQRPGVCNAIEVCLVNRAVLGEFIPKLAERFAGRAQFRCDPESLVFMQGCPAAEGHVIAAGDDDFDTEFLDNILAIKTVGSVEEATAHINAHNTKHSESIVTSDTAHARYFQATVDAACVYVNASTRFTDGEMFGYGAELGISTQKMHVRGPMGLTALTTVKYLIDGDGQVR